MRLAGSLTLFAVLGTMEISPEAVDMGEVWQGELVTRVFAVKNTGPASLELAPPRSGCVCADVRLDIRSIPLGKTANLTVTVGRTRPGTFDTYVAVFDQNAPARFARARYWIKAWRVARQEYRHERHGCVSAGFFVGE